MEALKALMKGTSLSRHRCRERGAATMFALHRRNKPGRAGQGCATAFKAQAPRI